MRAWILLAALALAAPGEEARGPRPVAFVFRVEGEVRLGGTPPEAAEPWRRLPPGAVLETSAGATVSVVYFGSGRIYLLEPGGQAKVTPREFLASRGKVRLIKNFPAKVKLAPLLGPGAHRRPAVGNVRGEEGSGIPLVAADGAVICLAEGRGKVEILDERERVIHTAEAAPRIQIPAGVLKPGGDYSFRVGGKERLFATLDRGQGRARAALWKEVARGADPDLKALLERADEELGVRECLGDDAPALPRSPP